MIKEAILPLFFVLTGGPGSGKSSVLNELKKEGYAVVEESGRKIIQEQMAQGGDALPWKNKEKFRDLMVQEDIRKYQEAQNLDGIVLFDRGVPDSLGYSYLEKIPVESSLEAVVEKHPYQPVIFMMPPWEEIYENDTERKQDFEKSVETYEAMKEVYIKLGYTIMELPKLSILQRVKFIRSIIKQKEKHFN